MNTALFFTLFALSNLALAAIPDLTVSGVPECQNRKKIMTVAEIRNAPRLNIVWECLELSSLSRTELIQLADYAPQINLLLSRVELSRTDFEEIQKKIPLRLTIDSQRLGRTDLIEIAKLGAMLTIYSNALSFNTTDYQEISKAGNFTLYVRSKQFSFRELKELALNKQIKMILDNSFTQLNAEQMKEIASVGTHINIIP